MMPQGNAAAHTAFRAAMDSGALHHAWLLAGPEGVGKAHFANAAALRLLAEAAAPERLVPGLDVPEGHPTKSLFLAGSHPDFRALERLPKDKEKETPERVRSITIDQVRGLQRLFATTPSMSFRRVVLIDAIDDLERGGANALLKSLEEPPSGTIFLLVSHTPGRLLPTIRSRCRLLRFGALSAIEMAAALHDAMPDTSAAEIAALARIGGGAPGRALRFAGLDMAGLENAMEAIARHGDGSNQARVALAKTLASKAAQPRYEAFLERAPSFIAERVLTASGAARAQGLATYETARALAASAIGLSLDPQATVFEMAGLLARLAPDAFNIGRR